MKVLISGYYGFDNFGDEAILSVFIKKFKELGFDITVCSVKPKKTAETYSVNSVQTFDYNAVLNEIKNTDILISGGGSLLQDTTSIKSLLYYAWVIFNALIFKKKVYILAQGIGPLNSFIAKFIVKSLLKKCCYISVRDEASKAILDNWNIKCDLVCDPLNDLEINCVEASSDIGVQLRSFKTLSGSFLEKLALKISENFPDRKIKIISLQDSLDLEVCKNFQTILDKHNLNSEVVHSLSVNEAIEQICSLEYLFAMRFHAVLTSLKAGVNTAAINYDIKVETLANKAEIPLITLTGDDLDEAFVKIKTLDMISIKSRVNETFIWPNFLA